MKKKFYIVICVLVLLFALDKIYNLIIINNVYYAIENFKNEENRYCSISKNISQNYFQKEELYVLKDILKINIYNNDKIEYLEWNQLKLDEQYAINYKKNEYKISEDVIINKKDIMLDLPMNIIDIFYKNNRFDLKEFLKIRCIIPITYNNEKCYKIVTSKEILIVNEKTYLPMYLSTKFANSMQNLSNDKIENYYEFKIGEVTEDDVALPDLTNFKFINNESE